MYRYDEFDQAFVEQRVAQFRDQVARRMSGELDEDSFKPLRLMNGLYLQLHAYMLRVAVPYGTLSPRQLRRLAQIAREHDRGYGHFTTRQNIQFNWIALDRAPDVLAELAEVQMHAIQTSGNCVRNVTADHFAGAAADEVEDARVWCEIIRQWSSLHPEFSFLPRKFKIAVTGSPQDRAAIRVHDIGLRLHRDDAGEVGFEVMVGGGLGRTPMLAHTIRDFLPKAELLRYLEAILRIYNRFGRRDNAFKARIKILVHDLGAARMAELVEAEYAATGSQGPELPQAEVDRIADYFRPPVFRGDAAADLTPLRLREPAFGHWLDTNISPHRAPGHAIVTISLKPHGGAPGDATAEQMELVADLAERYGYGEVRVTHEQNLVLPHVAEADLHPVWRALAGADLATANVGLLTDIVACPGLDFCSLATARSIPVAQRIARRFDDLRRLHDIGELKVKISGCINACGHHHIGHIGLLGVEKNGEEFYQITLGGSGSADAAIGTILGPAVSSDQVVAALERLVMTYLAQRAPGERFLDTYRRVGAAPFKESLHAAA